MFDTADIYSNGLAEEILGQAIKHGRANSVLISTKATFRFAEHGPNDVGIIALPPHPGDRGEPQAPGHGLHRRLPLHGFDALTPVEEVLDTLDNLVRAGKVRYIGCSNFSGWHLHEVARRRPTDTAWARYVAHQAYYSLIGRDYEWELMPLALDQRSRRGRLEPAGLGPPHRQDPPRPAAARSSRLQSKTVTDVGPPVADEYLYKVVDALDEVAEETGKTVPQIALNWLLQRPTVASVIIGARNEEQLRAEPRRPSAGT